MQSCHILKSRFRQSVKGKHRGLPPIAIKLRQEFQSPISATDIGRYQNPLRFFGNRKHTFILPSGMTKSDVIQNALFMP